MLDDLIREHDVEGAEIGEGEGVAGDETDVAAFVTRLRVIEKLRADVDGRDAASRLGEQQRERRLRRADIENAARAESSGNVEIDIELIVIRIEHVALDRVVPDLAHVVA